MPEKLIIVCFAVKEEARPFQKLAEGRTNIKILLTGMGHVNADKSIRAALAADKPSLVLTCGFAGGLNPELASGTIVFSTRGYSELETRLREAGAVPAQFYCADHVATTVSEKTKLWQTTGDDAVDMESEMIARICFEKKFPCATVRVILDAADENLPLDFNELMTADHKMNYGKLAWQIIKSPGKIRALKALQKQSQAAAEKLAQALIKLISE